MRKSTALKAASQFFSLLLCLILLPAAFAQPEELNGTATYENGTYESNIVSGLEEIYGNYTVHDINPSYYSVYLMPGENETFNVSFRNEGNENLDIAPKVVAPADDYYYDVVNESWITILPENVTVSPGVEQNFTIEVSVPEDTETGDYEAQIAFTNDTYPEEYDTPVYIQESAEGSDDSLSAEGYSDPMYVNAMYLCVSVPVRPKLELQTSYISDTIEPGKEYVYAVKIKNVAGKDVTIDPKVTKYEVYDYSFEEPAFSDDTIEISAPSTIKAGEIANMTIRVPVPENASGSYDAYIEMNADGKENDGSVPQISLSFTVDKQPTTPYVRTFNTTTTDPIMLEVSAETSGQDDSVRISPEIEKPSFEINLKCNSSPVNLTLVKTSESGAVYSQGYIFPVWATEDSSSYQSDSREYTETYRAVGAIGTWELTILPKNTNSFDYSITVGESK
ncbi:COG1470 family protein [Methanosarcina barkeri]|uniref:NPCBM-associated, NEW3 domain of alpha-galactosidase n=1 Tax=Methanosarcina barkeri 227 TaxID=1434106 RepID=A0A0E3R0F4_METBA|nr:hypothetical protein [Methanosarcina barkeri]AKB57840.1 hypothetical protein MSBR2_1324 [Methanosarcina barkeri 227]